MKEQQLQLSFRSYDSMEELSTGDRHLMEKAQEALVKSYSPYSEFKVGAAVFLQNQQTVTGANQENAAYPMCLCAEMVTLSRVESEFPGMVIETIAITVKGEKVAEKPAAPCGACRQILFEKETRQQHPLRILIMGEVGPIFELASAKDLLPFAFGGDFL